MTIELALVAVLLKAQWLLGVLCGLVGLGMFSGWLLFHLIRFIRRNG